MVKLCHDSFQKRTVPARPVARAYHLQPEIKYPVDAEWPLIRVSGLQFSFPLMTPFLAGVTHVATARMVILQHRVSGLLFG